MEREPAVALLTAMRVALDSGALDDHDAAHVAEAVTNVRMMVELMDQNAAAERTTTRSEGSRPDLTVV